MTTDDTMQDVRLWAEERIGTCFVVGEQVKKGEYGKQRPDNVLIAVHNRCDNKAWRTLDLSQGSKGLPSIMPIRDTAVS